MLVEKTADLAGYSDAKFDFLTNEERRGLEEAIAQHALENNMVNGICRVAHYNISVSNVDLLFEACMEDDGSSSELLTPYDYRDGKFKNLDNCVTDSW